MKNINITATALALVGSTVLAASNDVVRVTELAPITIEATALSRYRPATVRGGTWTDLPPEKLPCVVDTITEDFIREHNPTDLNDLLRYVPGIETGGTSLLVRQPGLFSIRGGGGTEPAIDGLYSIGRGSGLFMDPFLLERVEVVKGPAAALTGGAGSPSNANGGSGAINLHLKGAQLDHDEIGFQENTSIGKHVFRQRGMIDANEIVVEDKAAFRVIGTADYYEPAYIHQGSQKGARGRESYSFAPSFVLRPSDDVTLGLKTLFQHTDAPSYIGVPVWKGKPAAGYAWYESSCRTSDRQKYDSLLLNPYVDWQVSDEWLLKFGGAFLLSSWEQTTREPYVNNRRLLNYWEYGKWLDDEKYMTSTFSKSKSLTRTGTVYARSVHTKEFANGLENSLLVQTDTSYREGGAFANAPWTRYGVTAQEMPSWGWFGLLGGVRYDYVRLGKYAGVKAQDAHAVSPRAGLTIRPIDELVFFGNLSQTRTPMFDAPDVNGHPLTKPWYSTQVEGGVRIKTCEKLWLSVSAYRIEQENMPVEGGQTSSGYWYTQDGRTTSRGAELSLSGDVTDDWTVMAMYAFNRYTNRSVSPGEKGRDFERYPEHAVTFNTSYRIASGPLEDITLGAGFRFRSMSYATMRGTYVHRNARFDPSYIFDTSVSVPFSKFGGSKDWIATFGIRNLFGEKYFDTSRHYYECFAGEPRTFEIGLRATF